VLPRTVCALFFGLTSVAAQTIQVDVNVVNVLCTVRDPHGALITTLKQDDFEVRENGGLQQIRYFTRDTDLPLTIALLVDVSGSVRRFVQAEKGAAIQFLREVLRPNDQALLTGFSSTIVLWQDFTSSLPMLESALGGMHAVPFRGLPKDGLAMPTTLLYDAMGSTALSKLKSVSGRKTMIIISDGMDLGSRNTLDAAVQAAQITNTIVYGICYSTGRESGCGYLKSLAQPTGGRMFELGPKSSLSVVFAAIQDELRSQYSLGYVSTNPARDGSFRKLQVKVHAGGLRAFSRKGYYARSVTEP
jgi:VWFA-related protein